MSASAQQVTCARTAYGTVVCNQAMQDSDATNQYRAYQNQVQQVPQYQAAPNTGWEWQQMPVERHSGSGVDWSTGQPQ